MGYKGEKVDQVRRKHGSCYIPSQGDVINKLTFKSLTTPSSPAQCQRSQLFRFLALTSWQAKVTLDLFVHSKYSPLFIFALFLSLHTKHVKINFLLLHVHIVGIN